MANAEREAIDFAYKDVRGKAIKKIQNNFPIRELCIIFVKNNLS